MLCSVSLVASFSMFKFCLKIRRCSGVPKGELIGNIFLILSSSKNHQMNLKSIKYKMDQREDLINVKMGSHCPKINNGQRAEQIWKRFDIRLEDVLLKVLYIICRVEDLYMPAGRRVGKYPCTNVLFRIGIYIGNKIHCNEYSGKKFLELSGIPSSSTVLLNHRALFSEKLKKNHH